MASAEQDAQLLVRTSNRMPRHGKSWHYGGASHGHRFSGQSLDCSVAWLEILYRGSLQRTSHSSLPGKIANTFGALANGQSAGSRILRESKFARATRLRNGRFATNAC